MEMLLLSKKIYFTGDYLLKGKTRTGIVAGMIALTEAVAIGRTFASMKDYQLDGNKEMVALGVMNIVGSMTSCYVATGSFSRSAVNYMAGCQALPVSTLSSVTQRDTSGIHAMEKLHKPKKCSENRHPGTDTRANHAASPKRRMHWLAELSEKQEKMQDNNC
ncbi:Solute carrier 26 [Datura stramonium]|uniref:Solute carrier 26 n=1 Tax=Datura stramonium TaxID=4076 RepID=A0ABS8WKY3_DATST|nr:Solute carrier 26 [Datura stramonium]